MGGDFQQPVRDLRIQRLLAKDFTYIWCDDGPGACCIPPKMTQAKATCADFGGICAPISGCNFVQGAYAAFEGCKGIPMICCVPHDICGDENESCCDNMTTYRTACDHGAWICTIDGTVKKPTDQCPK